MKQQNFPFAVKLAIINRTERSEKLNVFMAHEIPNSRDYRADITKETIRNCFRHDGLRVPGTTLKILRMATKPSLVLPKCGATAIAGSKVSEYVSVDDVVATPGEFGTLCPTSYRALVTAGAMKTATTFFFFFLPTTSEVIRALALVWCFFANVKGCSLSCSDSLGKCGEVSTVAGSEVVQPEEDTGLFYAKVRQFHR